MHGAVGVAAEAAHLASGEGDVGQAAEAVVPGREDGRKSTARTQEWDTRIILQSRDQVLVPSPRFFPDKTLLSVRTT